MFLLSSNAYEDDERLYLGGNNMEIRTEISQGIVDARLLEMDVIRFLNNKGVWDPDDYPLTNFETKVSNGYHSNSFAIGANISSTLCFDYKLYYEVLYAATKTFVRGRLGYWMFDESAPIRVSSPEIKFNGIEEYKKICISFNTSTN